MNHPLSYEKREPYACDVCGNVPDETGMIEHGKGCLTQDENGGGESWVEFAKEDLVPVKIEELVKAAEDIQSYLYRHNDHQFAKQMAILAGWTLYTCSEEIEVVNVSEEFDTSLTMGQALKALREATAYLGNPFIYKKTADGESVFTMDTHKRQENIICTDCGRPTDSHHKDCPQFPF